MKKIGIITFIVTFVIGLVLANIISYVKPSLGSLNFSIGFGGEKGSGNVRTEKRSAENFDQIDVSGVFRVEIYAQTDFDVEVEADDNLLPLIKTEVHGNVLKIETEKRINPSGPVIVRISAPNIKDLELSGVSKVNLSNLNNDSLQINTSGASKIKADGITQNLTINTSGASKIDAEDLRAENVSINSSGASKVYVYAANELKVYASGASAVTYTGTPKNLEKKTSGVSKVIQK